MRGPLLLLLPILLVGLLSGCSKARTEVIIGLATDLSAPDVLDHVRLSVQRQGVEIGRQDWDISGLPAMPYELPGSYGVYSADGSEPTVTADLYGYRADLQILHRQAIFSLISGKTVFLRMALVRKCMDASQCGPGLTCVEGRCVTPRVDTRVLPLYAEQMENFVSCDSGTTLINTSTRAALPVSGGDRACSGPCVEGTCYQPVSGDRGPGLDAGTEPGMDGGTGGVMPGTTQMIFSDPHSSPLGVQPDAMVIGDVNGDGKPDSVVTTAGVAKVGVLLGRGDGTFLPAVKSDAGSTRPGSLALGDVDGDSHLDLVITSSLDNSVSVMLGNGDGTFLPPHLIETPGMAPSSAAIADIDGDGKLDLIVSYFMSNAVGVLLGNGDGSFRFQRLYSTGAGPSAVAIGDLNGDGKQDLVVANSGDRYVSVLLGMGDGTFKTLPPAGVWSLPSSVSLADVNLDGQPDLVIALADSYGVLLGKGGGAFQLAPSFVEAGTMPAVAVDDVDGDGKPDLVVTSYGNHMMNDPASNYVGVLLGHGDGSFQQAQNIAVSGPVLPTLQDVNEDGKPDVVLAADLDKTVSVLLNLSPRQ